MVWNTHLPENCPPQEAQDAEGALYRLVSHSSPHPEDFRSWRETNMSKDLPKGMTECQAGGLSVYRDKADANRTIKRIPRFRKSQPALGILTPDFGKILFTPSKDSKSHHTWWLPSNTQPWTVFQIVPID